MVARRLAEESVQPASFAFTAENAKWAEWKIGLYPAGRQQSAVIPLLMRAQDQDGWISRATIETIADMLGMAYIRVLEVATFYTQFQLQPVGRNAHIQVCGTTPCMLRGAEQLIAICKSKIHPEPHHLNEDGTLSWEEVECAGACVNAPMISIYHDTYEDLTPERFEQIVDAFKAGQGATITPGPQVDRQYSSAAGGRTTLLDEPSAVREKFVPPAPPEAPAEPVAIAAAAAPTTAAKPRDVSEESAPAIKGTPAAAKVSQGKADAERGRANAAANADGEPNRAMRETATGSESPAGKIDGGARVEGGKKSRTIIAPRANPQEVVPNAEKGGDTPLFVAPEGEANDLKLISGIGPVLEGRLNALGITTWSQVAQFTADDIVKVEQTLNFKGRVTRDDWLNQAAALAKGGEAEYIRVFGKKPR